MPDEINNIILSQLGKNSRMPSQEIAKVLGDLGYSLTDRAIRQRLHRLEKNNTIIGYSTILNPEIVSEKVNRTVLLKFKMSATSSESIERLTDYVNESHFAHTQVELAETLIGCVISCLIQYHNTTLKQIIF